MGHNIFCSADVNHFTNDNILKSADVADVWKKMDGMTRYYEFTVFFLVVVTDKHTQQDYTELLVLKGSWVKKNQFPVIFLHQDTDISSIF